MNTIYYKFPNSGIAHQVFFDAGLFTSGRNGIKIKTSSLDYGMDLIGRISGAENFYHVNLKPLSESFVPPSGAEPYKIEPPLTPKRIFL